MSRTEGSEQLAASAIRHVVVVVPARNEEERLPRALAALDVAQEMLRTRLIRPPTVRVVLVLDRCTDNSAAVARDWPSVSSLAIDCGSVGPARAHGVQYGLDQSAESPRNIWIASTDADSAVPPEWLLTHVAQARAGVDMVLGMVRPDPADVTERTMVRWVGAHRPTDGHPHIHGANLGIRGDCYLRVGGFPPVRAHEDRLLVETVRQHGGVVISTAASPVLTSGRLVGRAPDGFAQHLRELTRQEATLVPDVR